MAQPVLTDTAPAPGGHYNQAMVAGDMIYISGQLPIPPKGGHALLDSDFGTQARQAIANMLAVLAAAGGSPASLLKTTIYLRDIDDWPRCNIIYAELLGDARPARSIVPTGPLHFGYLIEIEAVAIRNAAIL